LGLITGHGAVMVTRDYKTSLCFRIYDLRVLQNNPIVGIVDFGFGVLRAFVGFSGVFHFVVGFGCFGILVM
jgi:hypothetical protein